MKNRMAEVIRAKRQQQNMTQEQLAEQIDTTPGFVGQVERAETYPSAPVLAKIIQVLGIDANTLFFEIDESSTILQEISIRAQRLEPAKQEFVLDMIILVDRLSTDNTDSKENDK